jgi:ACS family hexuronate transporter-like MFS transporter
MARSRWIVTAVMALLAASTFLNYLDRQVLSLLARPVQDALAMDDRGYATVVTSFMVAYTLGNLSSGWLLDRLGALRAMSFFVGAWSVASCLSGLAHAMPQLAATRFFVGLFETGNFVAAPVVVALLLPARHKAMAIGVYTSAAMFGAAVSPPLITGIYSAVGWRMAFLLLGVAGIVWVALWCMLPTRSVAPAAPDAGTAAFRRDEGLELDTWREVLTEPRVWAFGLGFMLSFPVWFFYLNWFPKYLTDERGLSLLEMGSRAWVVYLAAGLGSLAAGPLIALLARRGLTQIRSRLTVMGAVAVIAPLGAVNYFEPSIEISIASAAVVAFLHLIWQVTITSLPLEIFNPRRMGKVLAVIGVTSGTGGIVSTWLIGSLVGRVSYRPMFVVMACAYVVALSVVLSLLARGRRAQDRPLLSA